MMLLMKRKPRPAAASKNVKRASRSTVTRCKAAPACAERTSAAQIRAWAARWKLAHRAAIEELRATPLDAKFRQLAVLMDSVDELGWREALREGEQQVRERWIRLRRVAGGQAKPT
jgi:hypothetical protein